MTSWFFIEMAAKSALICAVALLLAIAIRDRAASDRARVLRIGVGLLLALPLIDLALPALEIEAFAAPAMVDPSTLGGMQWQALTAAGAEAAEPSIWDDPAPLILLLWAAGALGVLARLGIGLFTLRRWTRAAAPATDPVWLAALERARIVSGAPDAVRLLVADKVPGPLGWGFRRPVILLDPDTYADREEAEAIMAHEVAHVARADWPALMATRLATALFWFNPLVWALAREQVQQAEEAADAHAAHAVDPTRYAETLLSWAQIGRGIAVPANSIAPARGLTRRVRAVLEPRLRERMAGSLRAVLAMLVCVGIAAPVAAVDLVEAAPPAPPAPRAPVAPAAPAAPDAVPPAPAADAPPAPAAPRTPRAAPAPAAPEAPVAPEAPEAPDAPAAPELAAMAAPATVRLVVPHVPTMVAAALDRIDSVKLAHAAGETRRVQVSRADLEEAFAEAGAARPLVHLAQAQLVDEDGLRLHLRSGLAVGSRGLLSGADGMERGAATMEEQARRFRDPDERARIIAHERERGRDVTDQELIDAAGEMEAGARELRQGAREMRRSARAMTIH